MRVVKKEIKFGNRNNQKMYYESYDNYKEFLELLEKRQNENPNRNIESIMGDPDWIGVRTFEEAKDLLLNGWSKEVETLKMKFNQELNSIEKKGKMKTFANVQGFMPIVSSAVMRLPNSMIDIKMENKKSKILKFMICIDRACSVGTKEIIEKTSKQLAVISSLERSGQYRCRIEIMFCPFDDSEPNKTICPCSIMVKRESQPFDIKRLAYPIIHPSMLRALMFAWEGSLPMKYSEYHFGGLGKSFDRWNLSSKNEFINAIKELNENVFVVDFKTDVEQMLKEGGVK